MYKRFTLIELQILWDCSRKLEFQVHQKEIRLLNYMNKYITHMKATFKTIPNRVLNRTEILISRTEDN